VDIRFLFICAAQLRERIRAAIRMAVDGIRGGITGAATATDVIAEELQAAAVRVMDGGTDNGNEPLSAVGPQNGQIDTEEPLNGAGAVVPEERVPDHGGQTVYAAPAASSAGSSSRADRRSFPRNNRPRPQRRHQTPASGARVYQCPQCPSSFARDGTLHNHQLSVHGAGHQCPHCPQVCSLSGNLRVHIRRCHPNI